MQGTLNQKRYDPHASPYAAQNKSVSFLSKSKEYEINKMQNNVTRAVSIPNPAYFSKLEGKL
jgi:hypothetical protein